MNRGANTGGGLEEGWKLRSVLNLGDFNAIQRGTQTSLAVPIQPTQLPPAANCLTFTHFSSYGKEAVSGDKTVSSTIPSS